MTIIFTSPSVIASGNQVYSEVVEVLASMNVDQVPVFVLSNHSKPVWFDKVFQGCGVNFFTRRGRQDGSYIAILGDEYNIPPHDFIVLGGSDDDVQMAKNGGAVLVPAGWISNWEATKYGIAVADAQEFKHIIHLVLVWPGKWFFEASQPWYAVRSLSNVSAMNVTNPQKKWASQVVNTVKAGGPRLQALLVVVARSLLMSGTANQSNLMWGVYPSSSSSNNDSEVLSELTHRLRTVVSKVRFAKVGEPLFIRHQQSTKRSSTQHLDRTDPSEQLETLHLNPFYKGKLKDRNVVVLDDCTTYGVSFGVSAALLRKAGAASVTCIALGKFGDQLRYYEIEIASDPFKPISNDQYQIVKKEYFSGTINSMAQTALINLIT